MERKQYPYNKKYMSAYDSLLHDLYTSDADKVRLKKIFELSQDTSMHISTGKELLLNDIPAIRKI